ncbi:hypothetical protein WICMUC_000256 [Wickerhamomyces mucosus]|uniref:Replication protein A C-terminal domain-containing protein n=1 Tax=Wickerhamomyces mucosus TaxID=1378264 RepID=A0A9P8TJ33_9ASCO|nr:hypothetical protein WICMUC_000256 [Wickerhamomyces mucosus]
MSTYQPYGGYQQNFSNDYTSGGFDANNQTSSQPNKTQTKNSLTSVTIKEVVESKQLIQDGEYSVHNLELNLVSFVGVVRNVTDNTSRLDIQVEDGTGSLDLRVWIDESKSNPYSDITTGIYVYCTGAVKEFNGKKNIQHVTIRKIEDPNEVIYHHLSAIDTYITAKNIGLNGANGANGSQKEGLFVSEPESGNVSVIDRIFNFINENTPSMPEGVPVTYIAQSLNLLTDDVVLHCGKLTEDAKIYLGYDENGYLAV